MGMLSTDHTAVGGAIVHGDGGSPSTNGTLVYLNGGDDLSPMLGRVEEAGGTVVVPKTEIGNDFGFFAHFIDTEGNKVGLHSMN
jgi:predicted enzyme related to lactoylglutathione lyase